MSRLRRLELHSRFFFITCNLQRGARPLCKEELDLLAVTLNQIRARIRFALSGYCFMPDHWHAIVFPEETTSISDVVMRLKLSAYQRIQKNRGTLQPIWQSRFYDRILRSRAEFDETLAYIHQNPVRKGLVEEAQAWKWSSARWFVDGGGPIEIDDIKIPLNPEDRI